jgi:hypothetical protein
MTLFDVFSAGDFPLVQTVDHKRVLLVFDHQFQLLVVVYITQVGDTVPQYRKSGYWVCVAVVEIGAVAL